MNRYLRYRKGWYFCLLFQMAGATFVIATLTGCGEKIEPAAPTPLPSPVGTGPKVSVINMPVVISTNVLRGLAEAEIPATFSDSGKLREKVGFEPFDHTFTINWKLDLRRHRLFVEVDNNSIILGTRVQGSLSAEKFGVSETADLDADFTAHATVTVTPEWRLRTHISGDINAHKAEFKFLNLITFSIRGIIEKGVRTRLNAAFSKVERKISENVKIKPEVEKVWEAFRRPIRLTQNPDTWLLLTPKQLRFGGFRKTGSEACVLVGMDSVLTSVVGSRPKDQDLGPLPPLLNPGNIQPGFAINATIQLDYSRIREVAGNLLLGGRQYKVKRNVNVTLKRIDVYGNGSELVFRLDLVADIPGKLFDTEGYVFLTGKPIYNPASYELSIDEFDYDLKTRNVLARTADYLLHQDFVKIIQSKLHWDLRDEIENQLDKLNKYFSHVNVADGVELSAIISKANVTGLCVMLDAISTNVAFEGKASLTIVALQQ